MSSAQQGTSRVAWRLWRVVQSKDGVEVVVWESPDGDAEFAREQFNHYARVAPATVRTELQFQDPPEPSPWEMVQWGGCAQ